MSYTDADVTKMLNDNPDLRFDTTGQDNVNYIKKQKTVKPTSKAHSKPKVASLPTKGIQVPNEGKRHYIAKIGYPGCKISVNHFKYRGTDKLVPEAEEFAIDLIDHIKRSGFKDWTAPIKVHIAGFFKNDRETPDTHNLLKLICDTIQKATGLNDKFYETETAQPSIVPKGTEPYLLITISEI